MSKKPETELITAPSFIFYQGDLHGGDGEYPIQVIFYKHNVELKMLDQSEHSILIRYGDLWPLFKEIEKFIPKSI